MAKNKQSIKIDADAQGFIKEIEKSAKSITSLNKELKLNQQQLKGSEGNTELLTTRVQELKERYEQQTKIVENTNKAYQKSVELFGENSEETEKWKNKLIEAKEKQERYKNALNETNKQLTLQSEKCIKAGEKIEKFGNKLTTVGEKIEKVGNKLSIVSAGIIAVAGGSLKASIDFESAFTGVEKTVDGTTEQLEELKQGILDMSTQLPSSAVEISAVAESAGQLGIQTDNVLSFTKTMIDMGNSTNLSSDEAATSLAKFANVVNMSADDYEKLGSTIVDLGNNFATTEADIVEMGTRLASTGKLTGLTEAQIMALATAMSSVGIEAEAGSSAMSKLLQKMSTTVETGKSGKLTLEDLAKVSGQTAKEFKKSFQEDSVKALSSFIEGLNNTERNGKSAIAILQDLGLTDVRMTNTVLSLSNAHGVMNKALKTADKAWKDNTALTNEANKRYATTESQIKMLKNEVVKLGIEFGNELAPSLRTLLKDAKPLLNTVADAIKQFSKLDTTTKQNIIGFGTLVVALGPFVKTAGSVINVAGKTTTTIGNVTKAIGVMKTGVESSSTSVNTLAKVLTGLSGTAGIATLAITALVGAYAVGKAQAEERQKYMTEEIEKLDEQIQSRKELTETVTKERDATLSQMSQVKDLTNELEGLVDENGRVKDGYEDRANFILGELNKSLGTEYKMTDGIIGKYKDLKKSVEDLIRTKQINAILQSEEALYNEGIEGKAEAYESVAKAQKNVTELQKKISDWEEKNGKIDDSIKGKLIRGLTVTTESHTELNNLRADLQVAQDELSKAEGNYKQKIDNINTYTRDATILLGDDVEAQKKLLQEKTIAHKSSSEDIAQSTKLTIDNYLYDLNEYKKAKEEALKVQDNTSAQYYQKQIENNEKLLQEQAKHLAEMTSTTEEMTPMQIEAWKQLATGSYDAYKEQISKMSPTMQKKLQDITGVITNDTTVVDAYKSLCSKVCAEGEKIDLSNVGEKWIKSLNKGLKDNIGLLKGTMTSIATVLSVKTNNINVSSTSGHADGLAYVPYNNYVARLHEGERVLTKKENAEYIRNNISNKNSRNVTLNVYTQSVTDGEIRRIKRIIESDWGDRI